MTYKHAEAFCLMTYRVRPINLKSPFQSRDTPNPNAPETLVIRNSRDGVTPFCMYRHGREYQHDMALMRRAPTQFYALTPGDLIWESLTLRQAADWALSAEMQEAYAHDLMVAQLEGPQDYVERYPTFAHFAMARAIAMYGNGGQPNLREVDQAWIDERKAEDLQRMSKGARGQDDMPYWMRSGRHG